MYELTIYDNAKQAIAKYHSIDEVKAFRDRAVAIESYAKQACDYELENQAARARIRAERRCGELLRDMEKAKGGGTGANQHRAASTKPEPAAKTPSLADMGLTKKQSSSFQALAKVPEDEFERALDIQGHKPTTTHIVEKVRNKKKDKSEPEPEPKRMPKISLRLWGNLVRFEEEKVFDTPLKKVLDDMTPSMRRDTERVIPKLKKWLSKYE